MLQVAIIPLVHTKKQLHIETFTVPFEVYLIDIKRNSLSSFAVGGK